MRVLHVISTLSPRIGGPAATLPDLCRALMERGHTVEIFTLQDTQDPVEPRTVADLAVSVFPVGRPRRYLMSRALAAALARRVGEFDLVHVHGLYRFPTPAAALVALRRRVPYVIRPHGTLNPYHRGVRSGRKAIYDGLIGRRILDRAAAMHYVSESERAHAEASGVRTPGFVVPHGIAARSPRPGHCSNGAGRSPTPLVTFLGRLTEKKGLDVLCDAFAIVRQSRPDAKLVIAGPDDDGLRERLERQTARLTVAEHVSFPGLVTGEAKDALLERTKVFVLPSRDENFGVAVLEAMAASRPVVVTPGVALHEHLLDADAGEVAEQEPAAVALAILSLLDDPVRARRLGANGRRLVEARFSLPAVAAELEARYEEVVSAGQRRRG